MGLLKRKVVRVGFEMTTFDYFSIPWNMHLVVKSNRSFKRKKNGRILNAASPPPFQQHLPIELVWASPVDPQAAFHRVPVAVV